MSDRVKFTPIIPTPFAQGNWMAVVRGSRREWAWDRGRWIEGDRLSLEKIRTKKCAAPGTHDAFCGAERKAFKHS
ncbi:MAG: hypothetical protein OHK0035_29210 [Cyanobacteria bacterium J069]